MSARADEIRRELVRRELASRSAPAAEATPERKGLGDHPIVGAFDIMGGGIAGLAERIEGLGRGVVGAINPNDTYDAARKRTAPPMRDPQPVTQAGKDLAGKLGTALSYTGIPQVANALGEGIESMAGPNVREAVGTIAETATLGVPIMRGRSAAPLAQAVENAERLGYIVPAYTRVGRQGQTAGGVIERASEAVSGAPADALKATRNQNVTDRLLARANKLETEYPTTESVAAAVKRAETPFEDVRKTGLHFASDGDYMQAVNDMAGSQQGSAGVKLPVDAAVAKLQRAMRDTREHSADSLINQIGVLRSQGFRALGGVDDAAAIRGAAMLKGADALEGLLERGMNRAATRAETASPAAAALLRRLSSQYTAGRAARSDLHVLEESLLPGGTGVVDAGRLARISERRGGLNNPLMQKVAEVAQNFETVTTPLPQAVRGAVRSGISTATRNETGIIGATIGRMLSRGALQSARSRRAGSSGAITRAIARAGAVSTARAAALDQAIKDEK